MGKKNKKLEEGLSWIDSMMGKNRDIEERYGVERASFGGKPGESGQREAFNDMKNYNDNIVEGFRNDYDARRTLEAAALSGKGKAQKLLDKGFDDVNDVRKAQNFFEKAAKRHGQGGSFSSASDYMGLTQSMVERDRDKQMSKIQGMIDTSLEDMEFADKDEEPAHSYDGEIGTRGGRENNYSPVVDYENVYTMANISNGSYSTGGEGQAATEASVDGPSLGAAEQLAKFQQEVRRGAALAGVQTRGPQSGVIPGDGF